MNQPVPRKCSNCGGDQFGLLERDGGEYAALVSVSKNEIGKYIISEKNLFPVTPVICSDCKNVMLFSVT